ncbi:Integrase core domain [Yersinia aldovae]|uniref:integrase catalytic domain-containing protein n=1 Tax=Yersinia aldovae TaxID=29483 RepID=UPI0005E91B5B|nr:DDE-type integrase/transposase/recombinase [Yersinia aldovae]CNJ03881.1 Integrase core domain [Yersinia aldovae]
MNAALIQRLVAISDAVSAAGHGNKEAIYQSACQELQMSRSTILKKLKSVQAATPRKKRADAGKTTLTREDALVISGIWLESRRNNDKRLYSLDNVVKHLRTNGMITAGRTDEETGEFFPLSVDAISRALRGYRLHYDQLQNPAPALELASLHPNHVWQVDASLCVLYYLKNPNKKAKGDTGLRVMSRDEFYKNKPKNMERIVNDRVWSFELIDHTTHWIYVEYHFGGESAENFLTVMINAMQERGGADILHGVPTILYTDPGSALVSASLVNMCQALGIQCLQHKARNARATGAVEKARDIIECDFEAGLRFVQVDNIGQLNHYVRLWRMNYNRTQVHSRYGLTRTEGWLKITTEQLVKAPSVDVCRELAISAPKECKVTSQLRVAFRAQTYCVRDIPGACVGDWLKVSRNPWHENEARVVVMGEDGFTTYFPIYAKDKNDWGYTDTASILGQQYGQIPETDAQRNRAEVEQRTYSTHSQEETDAARKAKALPFGGRFNPYMEIEQAEHPAYLPKRGQASPVRVPHIDVCPLTHVEAAKLLRKQFLAQGLEWQAQHYALLVQRFPDGVQADDINTAAESLMNKNSVVLSIVNGH